MLTNFEGTVLHRYVDQAGVITVGTGHALTAAEKANGAWVEGITHAEAKELLRLDVGKAERAVNTMVLVPLEQHQFDALVSFTFNLGVGALQTSTLLTLLNAGDYASVPAQLERWCKRKDPKTGQLVADAGLLKRRQAEGRVWIGGYGGKAADEALRQAANVAVARQFTQTELLEGKKDPEDSA